MANADAALHRAKSDGRGTVRFFDSATDMRLRERRALQHELRAGVPGELIVHYQPQLRAEGGLIGFEALLRWQHPTRGLLPAAQFISVAEDSGQIFAIGAWVLREACREAASWPAPTEVAVNLSPLQFRQGNLPALVRATLAETGLLPERLELEITENLLIDDHAGALAILRELKAIGVRIALDDFGTGYSSLSYLQSFPFDKIKIDRSFVSNLQSGAQSASIIRAIIALAHGLNVPVLAEGVESDAQRAFLAQEGCDGLQGYLFGFPGPIEQYRHLFNSRGAHGPIVPDAA
jgi:EAL domain-containing protein (putative c-di-GMP-specific phosphodiesterase class I)